MPFVSHWLSILRVLAIETSSEFCSAALWRDGDVDELEEHAGQRHSSMLIGMIDTLLKRHAVAVPELDGIAYGEGPGTFTGLRIACGVVQGLAVTGNVPVLGVNTLLAMADASGRHKVVCCIDARMNEVYYAAYTRTADAWQVIREPGVCKPVEVPPLDGQDWHGCGNGFVVYRDTLLGRYAANLVDVDETSHAHAAQIARLAAPDFARGLGRDAASAAPIYVRDKVALKTHER